MTIAMPVPDAETLAKRERIARALRAIVPGAKGSGGGVIDAPEALRPWESDGLTAYRQPPMMVVLPETTAQVSAVLKWCHAEGVKVVPRGAGTSLSGGALPLADAVLLGLGKFKRVLEIDYEDRVAVVQPGVTNLAITQAVEGRGFYYAPDPSSQIACTIGGNVAENSGGVHCLKYGLTTNNVLGVEIVMMDGEIVRLGGRHLDSCGLDLLGVVVGSEGLLGVVTEVTVRILPKPETARAVLVGFPDAEQAGACVAQVIAEGIIPAGMEMMDGPAIHAAEAFVQVGYPLDVGALLIVEVDGPAAECDFLIGEIARIANANGAVTSRVSDNEAERMAFWAGRKAAFPAVGRISPDYLCMDGTIPRRRLPDVLRRMEELSGDYGLRVANVFHAGDGNLHPLILYDANVPGELDKAEAFGADILRLCVAVGGVLTGEHGVGIEKRDLMPEMFSEADLKQQQRVKCAFDPELLLNPGKVFPVLHRCAELGRMHVHHGALPHPELPEVLMLEPRDAADLAEIVAGAAASGRKLELRGGGTKAGFGAPREAEIVSLAGMAGVVDYDPAELVLTVRAGTLLADVQALVASEGQMLAFEPWGEPGATIGGTMAAGVAGSRRVTAGSARDHLLGLTAVSGRGEVFVAGAKVVKNVTGYDLPKLMAGSWGRLGAMAELTVKVLPLPREVVTLAARGLSPAAAHAAMACALGSNAEVSAAAALSDGTVLLRVAGFAPSVAARCAALPGLLAGHCALERLEDAAPRWQQAMTGAGLKGAVRWDIHLPPRAAPALIAALPAGAEWAMDWGGGRVWVCCHDEDDAVRQLAARLGGEARLIAAPEAMRAHVPAFHPRARGFMALEARVRRAFDPKDVFAAGRFAEDAGADAVSA